MLNLRNDLYSRLVISAQKDRALNLQFKKSIYSNNWNIDNVNPELSGNLAIARQIISEKNTSREEFVSNHKLNSSSILRRVTPSDKIEEKVEKILSTSTISEIQLDLEFAEQLLKKIKSKDAHNPKIPIIEHTIARLKIIIAKKSS